MENFSEILGSLTSSNQDTIKTTIPKELQDMYPYGQFPLRYTKSGQEVIRKQSEQRFINEPVAIDSNTNQNSNNNGLSLSTMIPIIQLLAGGKKSPKDMMSIFSKLLFKDNPDMQKLFSLMPNIKGQELHTETQDFPDTNKINICALKKIE